MSVSKMTNYVLDMAVWTVFTSWMVQHAAQGSCPMGFFGYLCQYACHCQYGAACHSVTGECMEECEFGWSGKPTCQIQNVALDKVSHQDGHNTSVLAVDGVREQNGSTGRCTRAYSTSNVFRVQWYVDLGREYHIKKIKIYFRNDQPYNEGRRKGVRVYVSNTPVFTDGALCYTSQIRNNEFFTPPDTLTLNNCTHKGRFVTVYNQRPIVNPAACPRTDYSCWANLEICEVEVYACAFGTYGPNCEHQCNCKGETCDPETGLCPSGCSEGRMGPKCDQDCAPGLFGENCANFCGYCRNGQACDAVSGKCPEDKCDPGWEGALCKNECNKYKFGEDCQLDCGNCLGLKDCEKSSGICKEGCHSNWYGPNCNYSCPIGMYSGACDKICGYCAENAPCHSTTGLCPNGCQPGYMSERCDLECPRFTYGEGCFERCGNCANGATCDHVTGTCSKGCMPGYTGAKCDTVCDTGFYGENCQLPCDNCRDLKCHHVTGQCMDNCRPGWKNLPFCDQKCTPGMFGDQCINICGPCKEGQPCDHVTGECSNGCQAGWIGMQCSETCPLNTYGEQCLFECGHCVGNSTCVPEDGVCPEGCRDGYIGEKCISTKSEQMAPMTAVVGGTTGGAVFAILLVILVVFFIRKRKEKNQENTSVDQNMNAHYANVMFGNLEELENQSFRISASSAVYYNLNIERGVNINQLNEYIHSMEANPDKYQTQFDELKDCPRFLHVEGQKKENKSKNRFLTTFPYDHSRVVLTFMKEGSGSNYINANYVDSMDERKKYIATQGPKSNTIVDFWRMVWQENIHQVVMLSNIIEDGKVKCEKYWPEICEPLTFGDLEINLLSAKDFANYSLRQITISYKGEGRQIRQFHFTGWPDHGIPETLELVHFLKQVQSCDLYGQGPMLVHCSAGVGRTGTFIALDALYRHGLKIQFVEILGYVKRMRECRMSMIQNVDQYRLLHFALLEAFTYRETSVPQSEFMDYYRKICRQKPRLLYEEFQILNDSKPQYVSMDWTAAITDDNQMKNQSSDVLAVDQFRPYLNTYVPGTSDYINAVIIPSLRPSMDYIVTQSPLPDTVVDLWRLVYDHDVDVIVSLNSPDNQKEESVVWWPSEGETVCYGPLFVRMASVEQEHQGYTSKFVQIYKKGSGETRGVTSFHLSDWSAERETPQSLQTILSVAREVQQTVVSTSRVLVMCKDGAKCSGLYCALSLILDRLNIEGKVDVFHTVRKIHIRRPQFIGSIEQYSYLYDAIVEHLNTTVYGNV
ncbi:receptor-type tyrosine-protein phosphatase kappa-like [Saccostrea echinata]|uniref:receptor-type tyrosine-protein phosphatase kappa-like n=1 Tax=Saccostrea echinata TaxID=191078 RepID=UPI002A7FA42A|nr:receptor-type tyrosine-protein phosphatase kappa-like [Saccostrea echinata]